MYPTTKPTMAPTPTSGGVCPSEFLSGRDSLAGCVAGSSMIIWFSTWPPRTLDAAEGPRNPPVEFGTSHSCHANSEMKLEEIIRMQL